MKIIPVILCGGGGTRLWPKSKKHEAKQFINFGGWTLLEKTLQRVKSNIYDTLIRHIKSTLCTISPTYNYSATTPCLPAKPICYLKLRRKGEA